jgi:hypothetical protein
MYCPLSMQQENLFLIFTSLEVNDLEEILLQSVNLEL